MIKVDIVRDADNTIRINGRRRSTSETFAAYVAEHVLGLPRSF